MPALMQAEVPAALGRSAWRDNARDGSPTAPGRKRPAAHCRAERQRVRGGGSTIRAMATDRELDHTSRELLEALDDVKVLEGEKRHEPHAAPIGSTILPTASRTGQKTSTTSTPGTGQPEVLGRIVGAGDHLLTREVVDGLDRSRPRARRAGRGSGSPGCGGSGPHGPRGGGSSSRPRAPRSHGRAPRVRPRGAAPPGGSARRDRGARRRCRCRTGTAGRHLP